MFDKLMIRKKDMIVLEMGRCRDLLVRNTQVSQSWQQQQKGEPAEDNISRINVPSDFLGRTSVVIATRCSESQTPPLVSNMQRVHNVLKIARMTNANSLGKH